MMVENYLPPAQILDGSAAKISMHDFFKICGDEKFEFIRDIVLLSF